MTCDISCLFMEALHSLICKKEGGAGGVVITWMFCCLSMENRCGVLFPDFSGDVAVRIRMA